MTTLEAVRGMLEASGMSAYRVSLALGRSPNCVSGMLRRGSVPSADLLARIARICGYRLELIPDDGGDPITLDGD